MNICQEFNCPRGATVYLYISKYSPNETQLKSKAAQNHLKLNHYTGHIDTVAYCYAHLKMQPLAAVINEAVEWARG